MNTTVIAEVKILPMGTGQPGVSHLIADCVSLLDVAKDITWQVTPMATVIEGPLERILELAAKMHELPFSKGVQRVVTTINIDDRRDKKITMNGKVKAVEEKLGEAGKA